MNALEIKNLSKSYADFRLEPLSLTLPGGCILWIISENGLRYKLKIMYTTSLM